MKFKGWYKESVPETPSEQYRIRYIDILYFLEDDSMSIVEPKVENSGLPQGNEKLCFALSCIINVCSAYTSQVDVQLNYTMRLISTPSVLHLSHGFQCSPTLNCQPYEGRLPLTSWWRKSLNMTVGQSSLMSLTHYCYDWNSGSHCGWTCNQLTSQVDGGITGSRLRWSTLT